MIARRTPSWTIYMYSMKLNKVAAFKARRITHNNYNHYRLYNRNNSQLLIFQFKLQTTYQGFGPSSNK